MTSSRSRPARALLTLTALLALGLAACSEGPDRTSAAPASGGGAGAAAPPSTPAGPTGTALRVETVAGDFANPWDVAFVGGDRMLVTQRDGSLSLVTGLGPGARVTPVAADLASVYARGEGGLMGIAAAPDVATSGSFVTCQTHQEGGRPVDVRVVSWRLSPDGTRADRVQDPLVGGLPVNPSGRHSGCRPTFAPDGMLLVGTGDTARATIPQDRGSLGGKVLRIDPATGGPAPGNPFAASGSAAERLVSGYGHRNVQAVAVQPGTGRGWSAEHGPDIDDEVNVVVPGVELRLGPGPGRREPRRLRRVGADDRPRPLPGRRPRRVELGRLHRGDQRRGVPRRARVGGHGGPARRVRAEGREALLHAPGHRRRREPHRRGHRAAGARRRVRPPARRTSRARTARCT